MTLADRSIFVTGAASGIGRATALECARQGAAVALADISSTDTVAAEVRSLGVTAVTCTVDVSDEASVQSAVAQANEALGAIDGVAACAGIFDGADLGLVQDVALTTFNRTLAVNLGGIFLTCKHTLPLLRDHGGAVVAIASVAAIRGSQAGPGYTASKGGVDALTRLVASQYGPFGVRMNAILPGGVRTGMTAGFLDTPDAQRRAQETIPLRDFAHANQIGSVAAFLLSNDASHLTGQSIVVDGGWSIQ